MEEHVFLEKENIFISSTRLNFNKKIIAMSSICSVEISKEEVKPPKLLIGFSILAYLVALFNPDQVMKEYGLYFGTISLLVFFIFRYLREKNRKEAVIIGLISGESEVIDKTETEDLDSIYNAISEAIIFRGWNPTCIL